MRGIWHLQAPVTTPSPLAGEGGSFHRHGGGVGSHSSCSGAELLSVAPLEMPPHPDHRAAMIRPLPASGERSTCGAMILERGKRLAEAVPSPHLSPLAGRGRIASAIRVRGRLGKGSRDHLQNTADIAQDVVIPEPQDAVVARAQPLVADQVFRTIGVLPAIDFDDQSAVTADKIDRVRPDRLLTNKFVAEHAARPQLLPQKALGRGRVSSQIARPLSARLICLPHAKAPPRPARVAGRPLPASEERCKTKAFSSFRQHRAFA